MLRVFKRGRRLTLKKSSSWSCWSRRNSRRHFWNKDVDIDSEGDVRRVIPNLMFALYLENFSIRLTWMVVLTLLSVRRKTTVKWDIEILRVVLFTSKRIFSLILFKCFFTYWVFFSFRPPVRTLKIDPYNFVTRETNLSVLLRKCKTFIPKLE